ncbi:alpha/beta hydrolase fold [Musa troglodytarum]|uniref:Alpha/beta hydrolase fold n=1 Tax=Musa troglodytarum TaxID=320322 RepID=A0A9E7EC33_9LILI|nr:alpha/beta hydrolase fold [Musa troglodytarum]
MPSLLVTSTTSAAIPRVSIRVSVNGFPAFLPKEVDKIRDPFARDMAKRIERLPVKISFSTSSIMSSCVKPLQERGTEPVVLLHGFDSSCLEWRYSYPLLEGAGLDTWAVDILGWGFSDLRVSLFKLIHAILMEMLPPCNVAASVSSYTRYNVFIFLWRTYIARPMVLVGPSLGASVALDFVANHPETVSKLVMIDASVYAEGTGNLAKLPRIVAYAGVSILKSIPLRFYVNSLALNNVSLQSSWDSMNAGRLHCLQPWWEDATVDFMLSGGYDVQNHVKQIKQETLIIWGQDDQIVSSKLALRLHHELPDSTLVQIPGCGHIPHVEARVGGPVHSEVYSA